MRGRRATTPHHDSKPTRPKEQQHDHHPQTDRHHPGTTRHPRRDGSPTYPVLTVRSRYAAAFRRPASAFTVRAGWSSSARREGRARRSAISRIRRLATDGLLTAVAATHSAPSATRRRPLTMNDAATLAGYGFEDGHTLIGYHDSNVSRRKDRALQKVQLLHEVRRRQASPNCSLGSSDRPRRRCRLAAVRSRSAATKTEP